MGRDRRLCWCSSTRSIPDYFHRLMGGCRRLSNSRPEIDGLDDLLVRRRAGHVRSRRRSRVAPRAAGIRARPRRRARFCSPRGKSGSDRRATSVNPSRPRRISAPSNHPRRTLNRRHRPREDDRPNRRRRRRSRREIVDVLREAGVLDSTSPERCSAARTTKCRGSRGIETQMRFALDRDAAVYSGTVRRARVSREYHRGWMLDSGAAVFGRRSVGCGGRDCNLGPRELARLLAMAFCSTTTS